MTYGMPRRVDILEIRQRAPSSLALQLNRANITYIKSKQRPSNGTNL